MSIDLGFLGVLGIILIPVGILFSTALFIAKRYRRCASDQILVIYGRTSGGNTAKCLHGGGAFVWPLIQDYAYLSLAPMKINVELKGAISKENIRIHVPATFMVAISTLPAVMQNAAVRLLGAAPQEIAKVAEDVIFGQLRDVIASMSIVEVNQNRDQFLAKMKELVEVELNKVGLHIITVNIRDLDDESGYLKALGQKAAEEAKNKAMIEVAEQKKIGDTGVAQRERDRQVSVAQRLSEGAIGKKEAESQQRSKNAELEYLALDGENTAQAKVAESLAQKEMRAAKAYRDSQMARAEAEREVQEAEGKVEIARLEKEELSQKIVAQKIAQAEADASAARTITAAKAAAEALILQSQAQAEGIKKVKLAEAEGIKAVIEAKASGYHELAKALGEQAGTVLTIEQLPQLVAAQAEAIKGIKIDRLTVLDSPGKDGGSSLDHLMRGLMRSIPTLQELAKNAGLTLPEQLGGEGQAQPVAAQPKSEPIG